MPLPAIGLPISMYDIQTEYGGRNHIGMGEYYQNAVPSYTSIIMVAEVTKFKWR